MGVSEYKLVTKTPLQKNSANYIYSYMFPMNQDYIYGI